MSICKLKKVKENVLKHSRSPFFFEKFCLEGHRLFRNINYKISLCV